MILKIYPAPSKKWCPATSMVQPPQHSQERNSNVRSRPGQNLEEQRHNGSDGYILLLTYGDK